MPHRHVVSAACVGWFGVADVRLRRILIGPPDDRAHRCYACLASLKMVGEELSHQSLMVTELP